MTTKFFKHIILATGIATATVSCSSDFVETEFEQSVVAGPLTTSNEVDSFVRGIYTSMRSSTYYGRDFLVYAEVRSDEMFTNGYAGYFNSVANYTMTSADAYARDTYGQIYTAVGKANIVINTDINGITGTTADKKKVLYAQGQAHALRALFFFDLMRLYGQKYTGGDLGVVTPLEFDPKNSQARGTIAENEAQIEADFVKGLELMTANGNGTSKIDLTIPAVKSLMSRFYLYKGDYAKVRELAADVTSAGYSVVAADSYADSWKFPQQNNSIFELALGVAGSNGTTSIGYIYNGDGYGNTVINPDLVAKYDAKDVRKDIFQYIGAYDEYYVTGKYPDLEGTDNVKIVRIEEVLLNGVEAELNGGSVEKATEYYNALITKRGLAAVDTVTMDMLKLERSKELLGEGFRMWDMLRWGMEIERPSGALSSQDLIAFPIPRAETDIVGTKVVSNPGYDN